MRSLINLLDQRDVAPSPVEKNEPSPPIIGAERAEERIFEEAKKKGSIISGVRTKIGDRK